MTEGYQNVKVSQCVITENVGPPLPILLEQKHEICLTTCVVKSRQLRLVLIQLAAVWLL